MGHREAIYGPPGTGKTHMGIQRVITMLREGYEADDIAYTSFTRVAADVARDRAVDATGFDPKDFRWFGTIHALCGRLLSFNWRGSLLDDSRWEGQLLLRRFGHDNGFRFEFRADVDTEADLFSGDMAEGNLLLGFDNWARQCCLTVDAAIDKWRTISNVPLAPARARQFVTLYQEWKQSIARADYTDVLMRADRLGVSPPVRALVLDEAQDQSPLMWKLLDRWMAATERTILLGDDDQAIYAWMGADASLFLDRARAADDVVKLSQSYRLPRAVWQVGTSITDRMKEREPKVFSPRDDDGIALERLLSMLPLDDPDSGSWLVLARNTYLLADVRDHLEKRGIPYRSRRGFDPVRVYYPSARTITQLVRGHRVTADELDALTKHLQSPQDYSANVAKALAPAQRSKLPGLLGIDDLEAIGFTPVFVSRLRREPTPTRALAIFSAKGWPLTRTMTYLVKLQERWGDAVFDAPADGRYRIELSTIHAAKGDEADNVVLSTDCARSSLVTMEIDPDSEHRVFYVGVTRARKALYLLPPTDKTQYWPLSTGAWRQAAVR